MASCSVDEVKELTDLMMKVMDNQRRTSESMSKWNKSSNGNGNFGLNTENTSKEVANKTQEENLSILKEFDPTKLVIVH